MSKQYDIIGKSLREAASVLNDAGVSFRVVRRDGKSCVVTCDLRPDRVNLTMLDGKVESYTLG